MKSTHDSCCVVEIQEIEEDVIELLHVCGIVAVHHKLEVLFFHGRADE